MRITLLGTGADHCIPAFRCICPVCEEAREKRGRYVRQNSCAVIESENDEYMLIDMPPQILTLLSQNNIYDNKISTVLITHRHADHTLGLRYLFHASEKKKFRIDKETALYIPASALKSISKKLLSNKKENLFSSRKRYYDINIVRDEETFNLREWQITPIETNHLSLKPSGKPGDESLAYVIKDKEGKVFVYLLDAPVILPEKTLSFLKKLKIDCLVGDCTYKETTKASGHMDIKALISLKEKLKPARTIASHISHMNLSYKELEDKLNEHSIEIGYDGMKLEI